MEKNVFCVKVGDFNDFTNFTDFADFTDFQPLLIIAISMIPKLLTLTTFSSCKVAESDDFSPPFSRPLTHSSQEV